MEKHIVIINKEKIQEVEDLDLSFRELIGNKPVNEITVFSEKGDSKTASLEDRIGDYFETRRIDIGGTPKRYNCLELELKQNLKFDEYCKNNSCLIVDRKVYELSKNREKSKGHITLLGEKFYLKEKSQNTQLEISKEDFENLMFSNYFNHLGRFYAIEEGRGDIELNGKSYTITNSQPTTETMPTEKLKKYEIRYRESREVIIRKVY